MPEQEISTAGDGHGSAAPTHVIAHISDTHFLASNARLYDLAETDAPLRQVLAHLERSGIRLDALVFTGDLADLGESDAYQRIRSIVEPAAQRLGAELIWVMGNHDDRGRMRTDLLGEARSDEPVDRVFDLGGLRLIALDSSVPGYHHGELTTAQLDWLAEVLASPAPAGSIIALHHPPIPTTLPMMPILELRDQPAFADVVRGSDVRAILGGHLHYSTTSLFAGIPISVASSTCYAIDIAAERSTLSGLGGGQSFNLVEVYPGQVVHSVVPIGDFDVVSTIAPEIVAQFDALTAEERVDAFSRKPPVAG